MVKRRDPGLAQVSLRNVADRPALHHASPCQIGVKRQGPALGVHDLRVHEEVCQASIWRRGDSVALTAAEHTPRRSTLNCRSMEYCGMHCGSWKKVMRTPCLLQGVLRTFMCWSIYCDDHITLWWAVSDILDVIANLYSRRAGGYGLSRD